MIKNVLVKLTEACNMKCNICGQNEQRKNKKIHSFIDYNKLFNFFHNTNIKGMNICLWGGEPLLYPYLKEIVTYFKNENAIVGIITNGYYLDKYVEFFLDIELDYITISVDGLSSTHNVIRGINDAYERAEYSCKMLIYKKSKKNKYTPFININYTIQDNNIKDMIEMVKEIKEWGCNRVTFNFPILVDELLVTEFSTIGKTLFNTDFDSWRGYVVNDMKIDSVKLSETLNYIQNRYIDEQFSIEFSTKNMSIDANTIHQYLYFPNSEIIGEQVTCKCSISEDTLSIDANGNLVLCPDFPDTVIGNINENLLCDINNGSKLTKSTFKMPLCNRCCHRVY